MLNVSFSDTFLTDCVFLINLSLIFYKVFFEWHLTRSEGEKDNKGERRNDQKDAEAIDAFTRGCPVWVFVGILGDGDQDRAAHHSKNTDLTTKSIKILLYFLVTSKNKNLNCLFLRDSIAYIKEKSVGLTKCRLRLPARSISGIVMMVIKTMMAPTPMVAYWAWDASMPALLKKSVE